MSPPPPPPPPPHGDNPKTTSSGPNLPKGKYDIFIIPEHSAGSGFLYLPSLQPNINSFVAGFASALACVVVFQSMAPALQSWWTNFQGMGNMGMFLLMVAIGMGAWSLGRQQGDLPGGGQSPPRGSSGGGGYSSESFGGTGGTHSAPPPNSGPHPHQQAPPPQPEDPRAGGPKSSWQQPPPQPGTTRTETPKNTWEKAREETRKREEERKAKEAEQKRKDEAARRLKEMREREAREREQREKESREKAAKDRERAQQEARAKELRDKELRERLEREAREKLEREAREKVQREMLEAQRIERERREKEAKERAERLRKEEEESKARKGSTYAYSSVGERTSMWPNGRPPAASSHPPPASTTSSPAAAGKAASATTPTTTAAKKPPAPTAARSTTERNNNDVADDADAYSFRPYDKPKKKPAHKKSVSDFSEASWTPSQSTNRTTPPPSMRAPYATKDPDKIVIRAVYGFVNQFAKTPASQLISGVGTVTDGLILRITTEGLFIDDDVRGVAQREWDVKAWTLKLVEVWCPTHTLASTAASAASNSNNNPAATPSNHPFFKTMPGARRAADRGAGPKTLVGDDADEYLVDLLRACKDTCRLGLCPATASSSSASETASNSNNKSGEWKAKGLHLLRATIRDQEGKRYLFVLSEEESWKVAVGLQRLRRGTQVRALGVAGFSGLEARNMLETLGW